MTFTNKHDSKQLPLPFPERSDTPTPANDNDQKPKRKTPLEAIAGKCGDCTPYERSESGTHLQQIAICTMAACHLHPFRATPRGYKHYGVIDEAKVADLRVELDRRNRQRYRKTVDLN